MKETETCFEWEALTGDEYYQMRLESIGGLGANLCGKLLGELGAIYLGLNAAGFSSYGSEKRGSPVKAFVRWCPLEREIRVNSPVDTPHVLGLFHEALAGKEGILAGVTAGTKIVVNSPKTVQDLRQRLGLWGGILYAVDAGKIARDCHSRVNMVMLGAISKAVGVVPLDRVLELVEETLGKKYPNLLEANLLGVTKGFETAKGQILSEDSAYMAEPYMEIQSQWGYENAPIGGVNPLIGSTGGNDLSASREGFLPLFIQERCINCGLCDSTCPDMVFQFKPGRYKDKAAMVNTGLAYHYCKGCLRCVDICPTNALVAGLEAEHPNPQWFVRDKDLLPDHMDFEAVGANGWVTSESYLNQRRMDGGVV